MHYRLKVLRKAIVTLDAEILSEAGHSKRSAQAVETANRMLDELEDIANRPAEVSVLFRAKRLDSQEWVTGFFTKKKIGSLIVPVIEVYREWDSEDFIETYEIDGSTLTLAN